jgi:flavin reductase (DIM6/NTAB) family NADH-FMN oxidoreductase RutF
VACPTYKATFTGLLKLFLDRFAGGTGLRGVAVPLMLGAGPAHALAPELTLRPVLSEIGGTTVRGLYVLDSRYDDPSAYAEWLGANRTAVTRLTGNLTRSPCMTVSDLKTNQDLDPGRLREAFGAFPSGVIAVAARVDEDLVGLAASSFTSVSLEPALVSFSVANTSKTWPTLRRASHLGLTVLADHHGDVCRQLAGPLEHRFDGLDVTTSEQGATTIDDGSAQFDCTIYREVEAGDHTLVLLRLHAVEHADTSQPLVFHRSSFGRLEASA